MISTEITQMIQSAMKEMSKIIGSIKANPTFKNVDGAINS